MRVIVLDPEDVDELAEALEYAGQGRAVRVAIDADGFRCKVEGDQWSRPLGTERNE